MSTSSDKPKKHDYVIILTFEAKEGFNVEEAAGQLAIDLTDQYGHGGQYLMGYEGPFAKNISVMGAHDLGVKS